MSKLRGFRTFLFAFLVALEALLEPIVLGTGEIPWDRIWLVVAFAALRAITRTPPMKGDDDA